MFFITRLTENCNLAVIIPPSEQVFNAAMTNVAISRKSFNELDVQRERKGGGAGGGGFFESVGRDV